LLRSAASRQAERTVQRQTVKTRPYARDTIGAVL